jgi:hypothetical protein
MAIGGEGMGLVRFQDCRTTFLSAQALLVLIVGLTACGQERASDPLAAFSRETGDTVGVLRAVASAINEINARAEAARAAPDFPASCRPRGFRCWKIVTTEWYLSTGDRTTAVLADLLGVRATTRSLGLSPPPCPWSSGASGSGFRTAVRVRFTGPDVAQVALDRTCDNPPGSVHDVFATGVTFEVRRLRGVWHAELVGARIT